MATRLPQPGRGQADVLLKGAHLDDSAYAREKDVAVVRTDETWNYQYQSGQLRTKDISFRYSLRLEGAKWKISDGESFPLDEA